MFRKLLDQGEAGDNVGLLLRGIEKDQIKGVISFRVYPLSRFGFVDVD